MLDPVFPGLPAPEDISPLELAVEIDQSLIEPLEHAADLRELGEIAIDLARQVADAAAQLHLLRRLAPFRLRLRDEERSEEHTSELQSRLHLVCRLLLEKKKNTHTPSTS